MLQVVYACFLTFLSMFIIWGLLYLIFTFVLKKSCGEFKLFSYLLCLSLVIIMIYCIMSRLVSLYILCNIEPGWGCWFACL